MPRSELSGEHERESENETTDSVNLCFARHLPANRLRSQRFKATPENVAAAIEKCVTSLSISQIKNGEKKGSWIGSSHEGTGQTSLVALALLSAGKTPKSSEVSLALNYIRDKEPRKTYEAPLKVMVLCAAEPNKKQRPNPKVGELALSNAIAERWLDVRRKRWIRRRIQYPVRRFGPLGGKQNRDLQH